MICLLRDRERRPLLIGLNSEHRFFQKTSTISSPRPVLRILAGSASAQNRKSARASVDAGLSSWAADVMESARRATDPPGSGMDPNTGRRSTESRWGHRSGKGDPNGLGRGGLGRTRDLMHLDLVLVRAAVHRSRSPITPGTPLGQKPDRIRLR